ncbi:MAG: phytanoyl-CoA dioxygenase family protein [Fibrella sp.]|nr:phytanoyl-CoA dioxygenase family protein [Armatimonadota bacterium]
MTIAEALQELGVFPDTLSLEEKTALDRDGYLSLPGILSTDKVAAINDRLASLLETEGENAGKEVHQEAGTDRLSDLVNKGDVFTVFYSHPRVLAAIAHVLGENLKLSSLNARAALPGQGLQGLHADWHEAVAPGNYRVCNSIWLLDDFTALNGATRVVAGTHRSGKMPHEVMADPSQPHPGQQLILAPAGTVVVFNSHIWHGGTLNQTGDPRRAVHSYFCHRDEPQQLNQRQHLREETRSRLSPVLRTILDVG